MIVSTLLSRGLSAFSGVLVAVEIVWTLVCHGLTAFSGVLVAVVTVWTLVCHGLTAFSGVLVAVVIVWTLDPFALVFSFCKHASTFADDVAFILPMS